MQNRSLTILGLLALCAAWLGPVPQLAAHTFSAHMAMHMLNVAIAAPLLSLGIAGTRFDPVDRFPNAFAAIPASVAELIIVWGWHAPLPHHWARHSAVGIVAEQSSFLLAGIWVWLSAFGGRELTTSTDVAVQHRGRRGTGIVGLLLTSMHMTLLGALLGLAPRPLYAHHQGYGALTALGDQHLGGAIMLVVGGISYLAGGLWLTVAILRESSLSERRLS